MAGQDLKTIAYYDGDGVTVDYIFGFEYLRKGFVKAFIGDTELIRPDQFDLTGLNTIHLTNAPQVGQILRIQRVTDTTPLVGFNDGSILKAVDLDTSAIQSLHVAEEGRDIAALGISSNGDWDFDAKGRRIVNIGAGQAPTDAANMGQMWASEAASAGSAAAALASQQAAANSQVNAYNSEVAATNAATAAYNSEVAAAGSAAAALTSQQKADADAAGATNSAAAAAGSQAQALDAAAAAHTSEVNAAASAASIHGAVESTAADAAAAHADRLAADADAARAEAAANSVDFPIALGRIVAGVDENPAYPRASWKGGHTMPPIVDSAIYSWQPAPLNISSSIVPINAGFNLIYSSQTAAESSGYSVNSRLGISRRNGDYTGAAFTWSHAGENSIPLSAMNFDGSGALTIQSGIGETAAVLYPSGEINGSVSYGGLLTNYLNNVKGLANIQGITDGISIVSSGQARLTWHVPNVAAYIQYVDTGGNFHLSVSNGIDETKKLLTVNPAGDHLEFNTNIFSGAGQRMHWTSENGAQYFHIDNNGDVGGNTAWFGFGGVPSFAMNQPGEFHAKGDVIAFSGALSGSRSLTREVKTNKYPALSTLDAHPDEKGVIDICLILANEIDELKKTTEKLQKELDEFKSKPVPYTG
ncbi:phage tail fiber protein [Iodobacter sp.]|uniref:phage tail fiber domain-containing protein n=1 Tax=Iodobacter sp. TaxID=1915058 RepID=UPI0025E45914|nr:phage tail fiber protein [Iodobacter sp.]